MLDYNKVYHGDTFELIKDIPDGSIDLIIADGPYGVTTISWDKLCNITIQDFNLELIKLFSSKLKEGGILYLFGKQNCLDFIDYREYLTLQSRIIWYQPSSLSQGKKTYTNNYDIIAYLFKGDLPQCFNLDDIRVAQLTELQHRKRVEAVPSVRKGKYNKTAYNPKGKNPGDVWGDIKGLTYKSKELLDREVLNTIQKPEALMERLILASSNSADLILDPFAGVGTCPAVCKRLGRNYIAFEQNEEYVNMANKRITNTIVDNIIF